MADHKITRRDFLKASGLLALRAGVVGIGGAGYVRAIEPDWIDVTHVPLVLPRLSPEFHGYRIAQVSDVHLGDWMDRAHFEEVAGLTNKQQVDLIVVTGDLVTRHPERVAGDLVAVLSTLAARDGVLGVLGNHDHTSNPDTIRQALRVSGIRDLRNDVHILERGRALLNIGGVDDVWMRQARLDEMLKKMPAQGAAILLAHEPDYADTTAATGRFDLQMSGHSHGGQVVIPFCQPSTLPPMGRKYPSGQYRVGNMIQYTNRGVGMVRPHVRFNCRPEITVFTLLSPRA